MFLNGEEKQWQHKKNAVWGCMTEKDSQETKGAFREEVGVHGRPEIQQNNLEERWNLDRRGWDAKWKVRGLKEWISKRKILREKD